MSIEKVLKNIKADRAELEARLDKLGTAVPSAKADQSHPGGDAYCLLAFVVKREFEEAVARLDILGGSTRPTASRESNQGDHAEQVIDLTNYTETTDGGS